MDISMFLYYNKNMEKQNQYMLPFKIRELKKDEAPPKDLLLQADPSPKLVSEYLRKGICFIGEENGQPVAEYVLVDRGQGIAELINIAVAETHRGRGYGKKMVLHAIEETRRRGFSGIEVGTGNSSIDQIAFYQKCGFRIAGIIKNFFLDNYDEEIVENGIQCTDMIRFYLPLT
jgi:ribosomal protein S18 acetylase RimI-like enzyme